MGREEAPTPGGKAICGKAILSLDGMLLLPSQEWSLGGPCGSCRGCFYTETGRGENTTEKAYAEHSTYIIAAQPRTQQEQTGSSLSVGALMEDMRSP